MNILDALRIKMPFGRYRGVTLEEIAAADVLYFDWLKKKDLRDSYLTDAVAVVYDKHAETITAKLAAGEKPKLFDASESVTPETKVKQMSLF
ncbi:putative quorum-sensing-regulated virulence factor [Oleiharenicola lentus]|uniref:putative quorum-sensing-regulated virulence factor n=1 Tax=Oleiharenicola lentus TaxID=2508720 RepID=UPI003F67FAD4